LISSFLNIFANATGHRAVLLFASGQSHRKSFQLEMNNTGTAVANNARHHHGHDDPAQQCSKNFAPIHQGSFFQFLSALHAKKEIRSHKPMGRFKVDLVPGQCRPDQHSD